MDKIVNEIPTFSIDEFRFANLAEICSFIKKAKVLELGCGNGQISKFLALRKNEVSALDYEDKSEYFKGSTVKFFQCDLNKPLPFSNESFDFILAIEVLEHVSNLDYALGEIQRILKPNGILIVEVPNWIWNSFCDFSGNLFPILKLEKYIKKLFACNKTLACNKTQQKNEKTVNQFLSIARMMSFYIYIANYSKKNHIHKHRWRWWENKFRNFAFQVISIEGIHCFPLLSFLPMTIQQKIYNLERTRKNKKYLIEISSLVILILSKEWEGGK